MKTNEVNNVEVTSTKGGKGNRGKWIMAGLFCVIAGFCVMYFRPRPLQLNELVEGVTYEVVHHEWNEQEDVMMVEVVMPEEEETMIQVSTVIAEAVREHEKDSSQKVTVHVYHEAPAPEQPKGELGDGNHHTTVVVEELVKVYQFMDMTGVEKDILATEKWVIENSQYTEGHLVGEVVLVSEVDANVMFSQLKAIESEMARFNEVKEDKSTAFYSKEGNMTYVYSSLYPTSLITVKEVLVQK